jgi:hypothetical protein
VHACLFLVGHDKLIFITCDAQHQKRTPQHRVGAEIFCHRKQETDAWDFDTRFPAQRFVAPRLCNSGPGLKRPSAGLLTTGQPARLLARTSLFNFPPRALPQTQQQLTLVGAQGPLERCLCPLLVRTWGRLGGGTHTTHARMHACEIEHAAGVCGRASLTGSITVTEWTNDSGIRGWIYAKYLDIAGGGKKQWRHNAQTGTKTPPPQSPPPPPLRTSMALRLPSLLAYVVTTGIRHICHSACLADICYVCVCVCVGAAWGWWVRRKNNKSTAHGLGVTRPIRTAASTACRAPENINQIEINDRSYLYNPFSICATPTSLHLSINNNNNTFAPLI